MKIHEKKIKVPFKGKYDFFPVKNEVKTESSFLHDKKSFVLNQWDYGKRQAVSADAERLKRSVGGVVTFINPLNRLAGFIASLQHDPNDTFSTDRFAF